MRIRKSKKRKEKEQEKKKERFSKKSPNLAYAHAPKWNIVHFYIFIQMLLQCEKVLF